MKNYIETFTTIIILTFIVFGCVSLMQAQSELIAARETHAEVLRTVQESDEEVLEDMERLLTQLNNSVKAKHPNWDVELEKLESSNARDYVLVRLRYTVSIPLFGTVSIGKIEGYAR